MHILNGVKRIAVGVSGGVDSSVAALLLKNRTRIEILGVFMRNWDITDETGVCSVDSDYEDAFRVCKRLGIEFREANFVKSYWTEVFEELVADYESGYTPNPDILCNRRIKFRRFYDYIVESLECDAIATGHYARVSVKDGRAKLLKARDTEKDQTFFLSQIPQDTLQNCIFPLGDLLKKQVKLIASENHLEDIAKKKESMGICFIGSRNFQNFILDYITPQKGNFIDIDTGHKVGEHFGKHNFTLGQRCNIGGLKAPLYVARKTSSQTIYVAQGHDHPILWSRYFSTCQPYWIHSTPDELIRGIPFHCQFRFQHRNPLIDCVVLPLGSDILFVKIAEPLRALTPGQYAVFYKYDECLGSARMAYCGPSEFTLRNERTYASEPETEPIAADRMRCS